MTGAVAPIWAQDETGLTLQVTAGRIWYFGTAANCDFRLVGDGDEVWFTLQHAAVWSLRPVSPSPQIVLDGGRLPLGRGTAIAVEAARTIQVVGDGRLATVRLMPRDPRIDPPQPQVRGAAGGWDAPEGRLLQVGRVGGQADIQLAGFDIAEHHADVQWVGSVLHVTDRSRGLGVHVAGQPVLHTRLRPGHQFVIGHHVLEVGIRRLLLKPIRSGAPALVVNGLTAQYSGKEGARQGPSLSDVSFTVGERSMVAVLGPSGAGKSSLGLVLLGGVRRVTGTAHFKGADLKLQHSLWHLISFVPQAESLPLDLTVASALRFVARLRLPADLPTHDRDGRVHRVLESVELDAHRHKMVGELSGGQRRRVSVAMELLSDPLLLILDEPTSGLDEGLDKRMMQTLRTLADQGTSVLVITHNTSNLELASEALALTGKGEVGYFGPPDRLRDSFEADSYADVMDALRSGQRAPTPEPAPPKFISAGPVRQRPHKVTRVMLAREIARARTRRAWLLLNLLAAPVIIALLAAAAGSHGLRVPGGAGTGGPGTVLSVLAICIAFSAAQTSFTSLVTDRNLILREARWGLPARPVIWSRAMLASAIALWQAIVASSLFLLFRHAPATGLVLPAGPELVVSMMLLALASCALGLAVSAAATSLEKAVFALMGVSVFQVVLCGLVIPFARTRSIGERALAIMSDFAPTRWGAAAIASSINLNQLTQPVRAAVSDTSTRATPHPATDPLWTHAATNVWAAWAALAAMCVLFLLVAQILLTRATHKQV